MTVPATALSTGNLGCNSSQTEFPFLFGVAQASDLRVTLITVSTGVEVVLEETTHYTLAGTPTAWDAGGIAITWHYYDGGTVTTIATYSSAYQIRIDTDIPTTQESEFERGMGNLHFVTEEALDKLTRIAKQFEARIIALELIVFLAGIVPSETITYLGKLVSDPNTTGWGSAEAITVWGCLMSDGSYRMKYWNGTEILIIG